MLWGNGMEWPSPQASRIWELQPRPRGVPIVCLQNSYKSEHSSVYETADIYGVLLCMYLWATYVPWVWISETKYMIPSSRTLPSNWKENKEVSKIYKKDAMITAKKGIFNQVFSKARAPWRVRFSYRWAMLQLKTFWLQSITKFQISKTVLSINQKENGILN